MDFDGSSIVAGLSRSGSTWRSGSTKDVFSRSGRENDDEEALKWAALEKLPTYNRVRRGILTGAAGEKEEVDVENLGSPERRNLVERLVRVAEDDNEKFLMKLKSRLDRVGIENPKIEVRFENLEISSEVYIGSRGVPTVPNFFVNKIEVMLCLKELTQRCYVVLNFLDAIRKKYLCASWILFSMSCRDSSTSSIFFLAERDNGHTMDEFVPQRISAYISQHDQHIGEMTVRETLAFSARCQGVGTRYGEMLVGPAKAMFMDEISTGLDSSTTFQIINSLQQSIHILGGTALIALLQPAPEIYDLFDDIILLSEGHIVYQGPREHVLEFFKSMGFRCPDRKGVADFLQEVTSEKDQQQYWASIDEPYRFIEVKEFARAFLSFHVGSSVEEELSTPFDKTQNHPDLQTLSASFDGYNHYDSLPR